MTKIQSLAYIVAQSTDVARWKQYGEQMLGMMVAGAPAGGLRLKMDERDFRIAVEAGGEDRYIASGWEVASKADFDATVALLEGAGVKVTAGDAALCSARGFEAVASFGDPAGNHHELVYGYTGDKSAFKSPIGVSGFKTGKFGMGHTVLPAIPFDDTLALFRDVLGFGVSDIFEFKPAPEAPMMRIYFLHAGAGRHHSLALAEMPNPAGCVHVMVEVESMTEVGKAHDRLQQQGVKLMATLGQHENDHMTSFYMMTPSNFALEFGWGGMIIEPGKYETTHTERVSIWGHDFSVGFQ